MNQHQESPTQLHSHSAPRVQPVSISPYSLVAQQLFFKGLNSAQLQLLADSSMRTQFEPSQWIFQEGNPANRFYLILEGKVALKLGVKRNAPVLIQTIGRGADLGWSWLFPPYRMHFSAQAVEPTKAIFFLGLWLREQCEVDHDFGFEFTKRVAEVMIGNLQATQQQLLEYVRARNVIQHVPLPPV